MENPKQQNTSRFLTAAILSFAVLFGWSYFFGPKPPQNSNANTAANTETAATQPKSTPAPTPQTQPVAATADSVPNRVITIKSPLYEVKLDSKGAVASSWILNKDKSPNGEKDIWADGSNGTEKKPLQLISDEARNRRELPFRISTDDQTLNAWLNDRNYQVQGAEDTVTIGAGQEKQIVFALSENGVESTKTFVFRADNYIADLGVKLTRNGEEVPNTKLVIGASIGDHGINHHNFYHIESETVAAINDNISRHQGYYSFTYNGDSKESTLADTGKFEWAGVADSYFAMIAVPAAPGQGLEYRSTKYDVQINPVYDGILSWVLRREKTTETRHLVTTLMPIKADGSLTRVYTGTKDYFALNEYNTKLTEMVGRPIDIEDTINFSNYWWLRWLTKPLAVPILYSLTFLNQFTNNYGIAIIVFTFLFYSLLFPLRWSQSKSFKKAASNGPKMKELQEKIKDFQKKGVPMDDPRMRALQMEQLKMTKDALPIGGCLPMLLQFPLLIAFYTAVTVLLALRQADFLWLPDLSAGDPYHLLEFAFAFSMILSMKFTPTAPAVTPEQQMQQKMMTYLMPVMMLWVMWSAPAGLLLYWFFGNIVSFAQQMLINHWNKSNEPPKEEVVDTVPKNAKKVRSSLPT
ncbi:MAG: membrane protein insertase YidC [Acidobacteria bacterium]|nr:membrane protein insertase YidC [Acidobacteriota bacterium]MBK8147290.1 membrane protein insertase YidC [Acidobacteriota bacterium]MBK8810472.1 membrane protein insertase YidC [Acidobacteriota bacterium]